MEIVIGSQNLPKQRAVEKAFSKLYPGDPVELKTVAADSEVSSHPTNGQESLRGAFNRVRNARQESPGADFYVGIEGGLLRVEDRAWEHSWVVIEDKSGQTNTSLSAGLELKGKLLKAVLNGQELSDALRERHGKEDAGQRNGVYGIVTDDAVTRESATIDAVVFALAPFKNPQYFQ